MCGSAFVHTNAIESYQHASAKARPRGKLGAGGESVHLKAFSRTLSRALRVSTYGLLPSFLRTPYQFSSRSSALSIIDRYFLSSAGVPDGQSPWLRSLLFRRFSHVLGYKMAGGETKA